MFAINVFLIKLYLPVWDVLILSPERQRQQRQRHQRQRQQRQLPLSLTKGLFTQLNVQQKLQYRLVLTRQVPNQWTGFMGHINHRGNGHLIHLIGEFWA